MLKKPFSSPSKTEKKELDLEGWRALYDTQFHKTVTYKERNRFHTNLIREAEEAKDKEKPELPLSNVQNAMVFKRMCTKRQLVGSTF